MRLPAFLSRSRISSLPFAHGLIAAAVFCIVAALLTLTSGTTLAQQQPPPQPSPTLTPEKPPSLTNPVPDPKQDGVQYFAPTGHTLRGSFLQYWQQNGGLPQFGYPLTEEFTEPIGTDGAPIMVQYFERARFEHHPENQPPYNVLMGQLGIQAARKLGYAYGRYPDFGRASDYSWISGRVIVYGQPGLLGTGDVLCTVLTYLPTPRQKPSAFTFQLNRSLDNITGGQFIPPAGALSPEKSLMVFGRLAPDGFEGMRCITYSAMIYIVAKAQLQP